MPFRNWRRHDTWLHHPIYLQTFMTMLPSQLFHGASSTSNDKRSRSSSNDSQPQQVELWTAAHCPASTTEMPVGAISCSSKKMRMQICKSSPVASPPSRSGLVSPMSTDDEMINMSFFEGIVSPEEDELINLLDRDQPLPHKAIPPSHQTNAAKRSFQLPAPHSRSSQAVPANRQQIWRSAPPDPQQPKQGRPRAAEHRLASIPASRSSSPVALPCAVPISCTSLTNSSHHADQHPPPIQLPQRNGVLPTHPSSSLPIAIPIATPISHSQRLPKDMPRGTAYAPQYLSSYESGPTMRRTLSASSQILSPCASHTYEMMSNGCGRNLAARLQWTPEEDALIVASVRELGCKWRQIANRLHDRSDDSVRNRWKRVRHLPIHNGGNDLKPLPVELTPSKEPLKAESTPTTGGYGDDRGIVGGSEGGGEGGGDGGGSCDGGGGCDSEISALDRSERVSWSVSEDETIMRSVEELGNKWQKIALRLPGRTEHAIRNRFARLQALANRGQPIVLASSRGLPIGIQLV